VICDELELVHQLDRVWYSSSDPESLRKRSNVLEHLGNAVGFPPHLLGILTRGAEEMAQMMEVYQVHTAACHMVAGVLPTDLQLAIAVAFCKGFDGSEQRPESVLLPARKVCSRS